SRMLGRSRLRQPVISAQYLGDGACRGHSRLAKILEPLFDLAPAPGIVAEIAQRQHFGLGRCCRPAWAPLRPTRALVQAVPTFSPITRQPLVRSWPTDPETMAKLPNVGTVLHRKADELTTLPSCRQLTKWHPRTPPTRQSGKCQRCLR